MIKRFISDQSGATALEYAVIAALIGMVIIATVSLIGGTLEETFTNVQAGFPDA